ncbi:MAG: hypothetical protein FIB04_10790 [Gammaproteobacteria bacterium]|nr:hypothetical protein [Gammaproteobacteria bacterium]
MSDARQSRIAAVALAVGALALMLAAVHKAAGPFVKPPPIEQVIQDKARSMYDRALDALRGTDSPPPPVRPKHDVDQIVSGAAAGLGALAVALALIAYARRESLRASAAAAILGVAAMPWQLGLGVIVAMFFIAATTASIGRTQGPAPPD